MMVALFSPQRRMLPAIVVAVGAGLGADVGAYAAEAAPIDSLAAVMRPTRSTPPMGEIHLQPAPGCTAGADCVVTVTADLRPAAGDRRRVGFVFEAPASNLTSDGAWRCRPLSETDTICLARPGDTATPSRLTLRLPAATEGKPEPKLCARSIETGAAADVGGTAVDPRQVRLLQALLDDARATAPSVPDGALAGETRQALVARAREVGLGSETEAAMLAVVLGQELNRSAATLPACVALITPPAAVARATPEAQPKPAKPAVATGARPPVASADPPSGYYRPPVYVPPPFEDSVLLRPWRGVRPFTGLRRLFGG